jgi:tetratricopeptide (TPR) repeat protein
MVKQAQGDAAGADQAFAGARSTGEALLAETPDDPELLAALNDLYSQLSRVAVARGDLAQAEQAARRSLAVTERALELAPANREYRDNVASAHNALGQALHAGVGVTDAVDHFRAAIAIRETLAAEDPGNLEFKRKLMVSYGNLGDALGYQAGRNLGDTAGAADAFQKAVALAEWARAKDPADRRAQFDLANATLRLGSVGLEETGPTAARLQRLDEARQICDRLTSEDPHSDRYAVLCAAIDLKLGEALAAAGKTGPAIQQLEVARAVAAHVASSTARRTQLVLVAVHLAPLKADRPADALRLADFAATELKTKPLPNPFVDASARSDLGRAYAALADHAAPADRPVLTAKASAAFDESLTQWRTIKLPPAVEPQRTKQMAEVQAARDALSRPAGRHPRS